MVWALVLLSRSETRANVWINRKTKFSMDTRSLTGLVSLLIVKKSNLMPLIRAGFSELYCGQNWIVLGRTVLWTELYWAELYCGQNFIGQNCIVDRT